MSTRRNLLGVAAMVVTTSVRGADTPAMFWATVRPVKRSRSPDAALLSICARLADMQVEWQRLYDATSEEGPLTTPADHAWQAFSDNVWPRTALQPKGSTGEDVPALLLTHRATTPEGLKAKAAALLALDAAAAYCDLRDDIYELTLSLLRDVAGPAFRPVGADATPLRPVPATA